MRFIKGQRSPSSDTGEQRTILRYLVRRADKARDAGRHADAALLYREALAIAPDRANLHIQCAHMLKEAGDLAAAGRHYDRAYALNPRDADLSLQRGHFFKEAGRLNEALEAYRTAKTLKARWSEPDRWIAQIEYARTPPAVGIEPQDDQPAQPALRKELTAAEIARLIPELEPRPRSDLFHNHSESLDIRRLGRFERSFWGDARTLRGVEAIRGFCVSAHPVEEVRVLVNGLSIYRDKPKGGYLIAFERKPDRLRKYVFNIWYDFSQFARGRHAIEIRCTTSEGLSRSFHDHVVIEPPLRTAAHLGSDSFIDLTEPDSHLLEQRIRALPSMCRPAAREVLPSPPRQVLVMRTDQLGDLVSSVAAIRRLREILPEARLIGLMTHANGALAESLGLFDEVIAIEFADDRLERRRLMSLTDQEALRQRLELYGFDMAIDLSQSDVSRELLRLSGAPFLYGVAEGGRWPWLTADFSLTTRDVLNGKERIPHSTKTIALIETLGAMLRRSFEVIRRDDLGRARLAPFGIGMEEHYAVLHAGARVQFSRWPRFIELVEAILSRSDIKVVLMADLADDLASQIPVSLHQSDRFILIDRRLEFDDFDAFISFADFVVGNDSGPKHLAALRGTPVVTLFTARINWSEWGQEEIGSIISRRVPCAGCDIFHESEECGKDFCCISDIRVDEVMAAVGLTRRA